MLLLLPCPFMWLLSQKVGSSEITENAATVASQKIFSSLIHEFD